MNYRKYFIIHSVLGVHISQLLVYRTEKLNVCALILKSEGTEIITLEIQDDKFWLL